jgi:hypothetical protein
MPAAGKIDADLIFFRLRLAHTGARQPADPDGAGPAACINKRASLRDERG